MYFCIIFLLVNREKGGWAALLEMCKHIKSQAEPVLVGAYQGFQVSIHYRFLASRFVATLKGKLGHEVEQGADLPETEAYDSKEAGSQMIVAEDVVYGFRQKTEILFHEIDGQSAGEIEQTVWDYIDSKTQEKRFTTVPFYCKISLHKISQKKHTMMNLLFYSIKSNEKLQEVSQTWEKEILPHLPQNLEKLARKSGSFQRKRGISSAVDFLKILFLYAVSGISFRLLAAVACGLGISDISDTAWRKKKTEKSAEKWFPHKRKDFVLCGLRNSYYIAWRGIWQGRNSFVVPEQMAG